jgi:hypothetical protein
LKNSRYQASGVFTARSPQMQAEALQRSGYSESPTYSKALIGLINAYQLSQLDNKKANHDFTKWYVLGGAIVLAATAYAFRNELKETFKRKEHEQTY